MVHRVIRYFAAVAVGALIATAAYAQRPTCKLQAIEKKLTGPALTGFMKKCEEEMQVVCEKSAIERKLEGPGKAIYTRKCVTTYVGL